MNGKDILLGLKYVGDDLIEKAEYGQFPTAVEKEEQKKNTRPRIRRPLLIAAVITTMLLLVGCAVVYVLSLSELKLGDQLATRDVYDYDPNSGEAVSYVGQETYTQQALTLAGLDGTPASQAAREWYAFCESYDPDGTIQKAAWGKELELPEEYYGYGLYSQERETGRDSDQISFEASWQAGGIPDQQAAVPGFGYGERTESRQ